MKQTALVVCPGRGTYQKTELGSLAPFYGSKALKAIDQTRHQLGLTTVTELDSAPLYLNASHQKPENNAALIYAAGVAQFQSLQQDLAEQYDIVAVTGNSMGWYTALACAGVWAPGFGTEVVSAMAQLTAQAEGQQFIYPLLDEQWRLDPQKEAAVKHQLALHHGQLWMSIEYGGYAVMAGSKTAVTAAMAALPPVDGRFPLLLHGHAGFHSPLMQQASAAALARFSTEQFMRPQTALIDGSGTIWHPGAVDNKALWRYTFQTQVADCYHFSRALQVAVKEFAPDKLILLGPGQNLGGAVAQSLIEIGYAGLHSKQDFVALQQSDNPLLLEAQALLTEPEPA
ncbi:malonyl CoA-ACP transacylase [Rheinheimera sp. 4Y26]|uniref:malonyl CoA-ACP transacylase n=1 Tax=Rheinheimera sp. 4Y26 TaxID=2977811 RepID=UPI0021B0E579|nr:malonyl CoA-ACP transacylase [Rheinheimera sp. 4Y26]MCT6700769.1 malonyl CoA-ACP transacylase [Rheinheimera sp. 4Y26]